MSAISAGLAVSCKAISGSHWQRNRPIADLLAGRLGNTLFLAGLAALIAVPISLFLGILAALYRNSWLDRGINLTALAAISLPEFFVAYILIVFLAVQAGIFPSMSNVSADMAIGDRLYRTLLPAITLTLVVTAHMMRMTRAAIINLLASPYIEMARLKGLSPARIILTTRTAQCACADHQCHRPQS